MTLFESFDDPSGGGPQTPPDLPPVIDFSGGNTEQERDANNVPIPGEYYVVDPVPVGTVTFIQASAPWGSGYVIQSYAWSGGTPYSWYLSAGPQTQPSSGVHEVETNVATTMDTYIFVVDADARDYTINLTVQYTNGASGSATLDFTSIRPDADAYHTQRGIQSVTDKYVPPGGAGTWVTAWLNNPGIHIEMTAATDQFTAGQFMLLQIINNSTKTWTDAGGNPYSYTNNTQMEHVIFDPYGNPIVTVQDYNGPLLDDPPLGYNFKYMGVDRLIWTMGPNASWPTAPNDPAEMIDTPVFSRPANYQSLSVTTAYSTYLMYKPSGPTVAKVWVALAAVDWSWSKSMAKVNGTWTASPPTPQPVPTTRTPGGAGAFPRWVNLATMFNRSGQWLDPNLRS